MREVGVRELKRDLSIYLRQAAEGEPIRVTSHGQPLVDLVPARKHYGRSLRKLAAEGRLTLPTRSRPIERPKPIVTSRNALEILLEGRMEEN